MTDIKTVIQEIGSSFEEFKRANDARLAEIEKKGSADGLLTEKVEKLNDRLTELDAIQGEFDKLQAQVSRKSFVGIDPEAEKLEQKARDFESLCAKKRGVAPAGEFGASELKAYRTAFQEFMRKGDLMSLDAQKALSVGTDPDGGYTVEPDTTGRIVTKIFETSPMRQVAAVQTIGTDSLEGMFDLDEADAGWVGETGARAETDTPKLAKWRIPVHEMDAFPFATQKLLDDSEVNLEAWLADKVADKFARKENAAFVNGDGVGKPRGFLTYPDGTTLPGTIQQFKSGVNGGFATDGSGGDVLMDVIYGMKASLRNGARWLMPRGVTAAVRKIKDGDGNYLWQPGIAAGQSASLLGYAIVEMEDMPELDTGSLSMAFANMAECYQIVDRQSIRVLRDPYTKKPFVGFYSVKRVGGDVLNFEAIKLIRFDNA